MRARAPNHTAWEDVEIFRTGLDHAEVPKHSPAVSTNGALLEEETTALFNQRMIRYERRDCLAPMPACFQMRTTDVALPTAASQNLDRHLRFREASQVSTSCISLSLAQEDIVNMTAANYSQYGDSSARRGAYKVARLILWQFSGS